MAQKSYRIYTGKYSKAEKEKYSAFVEEQERIKKEEQEREKGD